MKTWFIFSDVHSFYDELMTALHKKHFNIDNPDHGIIFCGDMFDRGSQPVELYHFLRNIPKDRRVLIRGNHELLLRELVNRREVLSHDTHNGTEDTLYRIASLDPEWRENWYRRLSSYSLEEYNKWVSEYDQERGRVRRKLFNNTLLEEILDWIDSNEWVNYLETEHYIFVHSFIPIKENRKFKAWEGPLDLEQRNPEPREDWRSATQTEWEYAMWGCPWRKAQLKLNATGKTIVCGHWYTSDFFNNLGRGKRKETGDCPIFRSKRYKLIGLDSCTVLSHKVNVLVIPEEEL